jgi:hypothetical protein
MTRKYGPVDELQERVMDKIPVVARKIKKNESGNCGYKASQKSGKGWVFKAPCSVFCHAIQCRTYTAWYVV